MANVDSNIRSGSAPIPSKSQVWSYRAGNFRVAFRRRAKRAGKQSLSDIRWALEGADPTSTVFCGTFAASDGAAVPYRYWPADQPRACVVFLHGAFDYSGAFDDIGPRFAARGITSLAYDQRGFGATRSRRHWCGRKRMANDLADTIAWLRGRARELPIFVVGESMGAAVAVHAAATSELGAAGLVLAAPGAVSGSLRRLLASFALQLLNFFAPNGEVTLERLRTRELTPAAAIRLVCDPLVLRGVRPKMAFGLLELAVVAVEDARKVKLPTLTMVGSREDFVNTNCIKQLHRSLAGEKEWRRFEDGPHLLLHWTQAESVLNEVTDWIDGRI
jgi:alpha-beta hydrolase superfamily lysophospholipase